jgi:hypothetical protein
MNDIHLMHPCAIVNYNYGRRGISQLNLRYTVAYRRVDSRTIQYQAAFCSPGDAFDRSIGRKIAEGRLASNPHTFICKDELSDDMIQASIFAQIENSPVVRPWRWEYVRQADGPRVQPQPKNRRRTVNN